MKPILSKVIDYTAENPTGSDPIEHDSIEEDWKYMIPEKKVGATPKADWKISSEINANGHDESNVQQSRRIPVSPSPIKAVYPSLGMKDMYPQSSMPAFLTPGSEYQMSLGSKKGFHDITPLEKVNENQMVSNFSHLRSPDGLKPHLLNYSDPMGIQKFTPEPEPVDEDKEQEYINSFSDDHDTTSIRSDQALEATQEFIRNDYLSLKNQRDDMFRQQPILMSFYDPHSQCWNPSQQRRLQYGSTRHPFEMNMDYFEKPRLKWIPIRKLSIGGQNGSGFKPNRAPSNGHSAFKRHKISDTEEHLKPIDKSRSNSKYPIHHSKFCSMFIVGITRERLMMVD